MPPPAYRANGIECSPPDMPAPGSWGAAASAGAAVLSPREARSALRRCARACARPAYAAAPGVILSDDARRAWLSEWCASPPVLVNSSDELTELTVRSSSRTVSGQPPPRPPPQPPPPAPPQPPPALRQYVFALALANAAASTALWREPDSDAWLTGRVETLSTRLTGRDSSPLPSSAATKAGGTSKLLGMHAAMPAVAAAGTPAGNIPGPPVRDTLAEP
mmetsp:Transcript_22304/g.66493  ORF Transcript_22304/g.66493 Transcript_22304/m.66493 type:complete len:220 (-) Transcript_22304:155-814(-)